jgi:predicted permease
MRQRLRSLLWRIPVEDEVREELALHVELRTRDLVAGGMAPDAARAEAIRRLGDPRRIEATLQRLGGERNQRWARQEWLAELAHDLRFALRQARLQPGFTLAVVLTLGIGLGATTAIFSVLHAVVLAPFPFPQPERVLFVATTWKGAPSNTSAGNFDYLRQRVSTLDPIAASAFTNFNLTGGDQPERISALRSTSAFFQVFGIPPALGRTFSAGEDQPGRDKVAVLGHGFWQRRFAGDPSVVGRQLRMNNEAYEVIGVMPRSFDVVSDGADVLVPIAFTPERLAMYDEHYLDLTGRMAAGVSLPQVNDELGRIAAGLRQDHARFNVDRGAMARRYDEQVIGDYRLRLAVLMGAVLLVLVIACGNAANLQLARLAARSRELAIRAAIGAGRGRIVRQVLAESLVLAVLGGIAGLLMAIWAVPALVAAAPAGVPRLAEASLDRTVMLAAALLAIISALAVGLLPAWHATSTNVRGDLGDGKGHRGSTLKPRLRQALIAGQAAMVLTVLAGAALLVRSAINLQQVALGFDTAAVLRARIGLPATQYRTPEQVRATFHDLVERLKSAPGVALAAIDSQAPLVGAGGSNGLIPEGRPLRMESIINSRSHFISPDYFRLLRIPVAEGRGFSAADVRSAPLVMIVNQTLAREAFPGESPLGKRITCCEGGPDDPRWKTIVGVVADVRSSGPAQQTRPEFYLPVAQIPDEAWSWVQNTMDVMVRPATGDPAALAGVIRSTVRDIDPTLPVYATGTMDEGLRRTTSQARFNMLLMALLGGTGLLLAALGIYSVIAWLVAQRTHEIGLRMALGATPGAVVRQMVAHGLAPVSIGLIAGLAGAVATGRLLEGQLFQVSARDPLTLGAAALLLLLVATLAALLPAWRATGVDPARALHDA